MKVYSTGSLNVRFHATPDCASLHFHRKKEVQEHQVSELQGQEPCAKCFPEYPRPKVLHRHCTICNTGKTYPCSHNGGVLVLVPHSNSAPRMKYVWAEQAHHYRLAPEPIRV